MEFETCKIGVQILKSECLKTLILCQEKPISYCMMWKFVGHFGNLGYREAWMMGKEVPLKLV